jgi:hypothetical protein
MRSWPMRPSSLPPNSRDIVTAMELAELLAQEGLEPEALMTWARTRADALIAGIAADEQGELLRLLERDASIDVAAVKVTPVPVVKREPLRVVEPAPEPEPEPEPEAAVVEDSSPLPLTVDELPPPPETPRLAEGEPEPILETFDTGPIDLGTPEATALIVETATIPPAPEPEPEPEPSEDDEPELPVAVESAASEDELEEIEFDELVEIDDAELEVLDDLDEPENPLPKPPRRAAQQQDAPVRTGHTASVPVLEQPVQTGDTAVGAAPATDEDEPEDVDLDAPRGGDDDFDMDMDDD